MTCSTSEVAVRCSSASESSRARRWLRGKDSIGRSPDDLGDPSVGLLLAEAEAGHSHVEVLAFDESIEIHPARLLRARREWPRRRSATEQRDELAPIERALDEARSRQYRPGETALLTEF
jgi:hypothetical protein